MNTIVEVHSSVIEPFKRACRREGLCFNSRTTYFAYFRDGKMVGFAGIMLYSNKVVFKNGYVLPEYRRQGIFRALNEYRINIARRLNKRIEVNCTDKSLPLHLKSGAKIVKKYKTCTKVVYENKY